MTYMMDTRKRVMKYLEQNKSPVSYNNIRYLGTDAPVVRWSSVVSIVKDLESEGAVRVEVVRAGKTKAFMVVRR
jgi:hypothetical protein